MNKFPIVTVFLFALLVFSAGCTGIGWDRVADISTESLDDKGTAYEGNVVLYLALYDDGSTLVSDTAIFGANLPVDVKIYTSKYASDGKTRVPDRLLYEGSHIVNNIEAANNIGRINDEHIMIPRSELGEIMDDDLRYGIAEVVVHLPGDRILEDNAYLVRLKE